MALRPIYYDTETTGLTAARDRIIEIAAYDPVQDRSFVELINPGMPIPAESTAVCNITNDMVADKPPFEELCDAFTEFCTGDTVLIAHNNDNFDIHFLRHEYKRCGKELPDWRFIDSLKWARKYRRDLPKHSLQFLREIYGFEANNAHRALDDVIMLHQIFSAMIDDLNLDTVYQLLQSSGGQVNGSGEINEMPFGKHRGKPLEQVPKSYIRWLASDGAFEKEEMQGLKAAFQKRGLLPEPAIA